jgi:hypothetical protein
VVNHPLSARNNRLIAYARVMLAVFLLLAVTCGEAMNDGPPGFVIVLLGGYLLISALALLGIMVAPLRWQVLRAARAIVVVDTVTFCLLLYGTDSPGSSFFGALIFIILCATVQWGSRGAMLGGLLVAVMFVPTIGSHILLPDHRVALQGALIRLGSIAMISLLLVGIARNLERIMRELTHLSRPIVLRENSGELPLVACLTHALSVFEARRGLLLWDDPEEPILSMVEMDPDGSRIGTLPSMDEPLLAEWLDGSAFLYDRRSCTTLFRSGGRLSQMRQSPFSPFLEALTDCRQRCDRARAAA